MFCLSVSHKNRSTYEERFGLNEPILTIITTNKRWKKLIKIKPEYTSLEELLSHVQKNESYTASINYDQWNVRKDANNQMAKCLIIKKSTMHGIIAHFHDNETLQVSYIVPNVLLNAYFGKNQKAYRSIFEIIAGKIKDAVLAGSQKKAFEEMEQALPKMAA